MIKLSILIPIYNVEKYFSRCLDSLFHEQAKDLVEYIFVDDCSKDESVNILKTYMSKHPEENIRLITHEHNQGLAAARLTGITHAEGVYVWCIDSDDWIENDAIDILLKNIGDERLDIIWFSAKWHGGENYNRRPKTNADTILYNLAWASIWSCITKKDFLLKNNILPYIGYNYGEDFNMTARMACMTNSTKQIKDILYNYRRESSGSYTDLCVNKNREIKLLLEKTRGTLNVINYYRSQNKFDKHRRAIFFNQANMLNQLKRNNIDCADETRQLHDNMNACRMATRWFDLIGDIAGYKIQRYYIRILRRIFLMF